MGSKLSFLRFPSLSQPSFPPEDQLRLMITHQVEEEEEENQKEIHSQHTVSSESDESSPRQDEEVVNDSPSVSDDQTLMRTPCVRKPTPMKTTTRQPVKRRLSPEFEKNADEEVREKKKKKAKVVVEQEAAKMKPGRNRLWREEDEVSILRGLVDFQKKKGAEAADTCRDHIGEFHELIKESLSVNASNNQLLDKIRKLRRKYTNNVAKGGRKGLLSKPHELECFELSKRIWIDGGGGGGGGGGGALGEKAEELEEKWRIWRADEVALRLRHDELMEEQKKLMLDVVRASKE